MVGDAIAQGIFHNFLWRDRRCIWVIGPRLNLS